MVETGSGVALVVEMGTAVSAETSRRLGISIRWSLLDGVSSIGYGWYVVLVAVSYRGMLRRVCGRRARGNILLESDMVTWRMLAHVPTLSSLH